MSVRGPAQALLAGERSRQLTLRLGRPRMRRAERLFSIADGGAEQGFRVLWPPAFDERAAEPDPGVGQPTLPGLGGRRLEAGQHFSQRPLRAGA